jgi:hypothetical protein
MKKYLVSLICALAASAAWAQNPVTVSVAPEANTVVPTSNTAVAGSVMAATAQVGTAHFGKCDASCPKTKTVCVSMPDKEKKTKVLFSSDCETKCHKAPFQFLRKGGDCNSCQEGSCGHSYVARSLYKRVQTTECDTFKCVPTQVPVCETPKCAPNCPPVCVNGACPAATAQAPSADITRVRASVTFAEVPATATRP